MQTFITGNEEEIYMNCRKIYRPAAVLMLSAAIVGTTVTPAFAAQKNTQKEENVYVNLKEDGSVDGVYVVNAYDLKKDQKFWIMGITQR